MTAAETGRHKGEPSNLKKVIAASAAILAAGGYLGHAEYIHSQQHDSPNATREQRMAQIIAIQNHVSIDVVLGKGLRDPTLLAGSKYKATKQQQEQLNDSVFKLGVRTKHHSEANWFGNCTATKVRVANKIRILTAAHCIDDGRAPASSVNVTKLSPSQYGVFSANAFSKTDKPKPLGLATAVVKEIDGTHDLALLKIQSSDSAFTNAPAITINKILNARPSVGEQLSLHSIPGANDNKALNAIGTYLGTTKGSSNTSSRFEFVGITAASPQTDACNFGASGSIAHFAGGGYTGPLSTRSNTGYGAAMESQPGDDISGSIAERLRLESKLALDLSEYATICGYSTIDKSAVNRLEHEIESSNPIIAGK